MNETTSLDPVRGLLRALTTMQRILTDRIYQPLDLARENRPMERETDTLLEVYDSLLDRIGRQVPKPIRIRQFYAFLVTFMLLFF